MLTCVEIVDKKGKLERGKECKTRWQSKMGIDKALMQWNSEQKTVRNEKCGNRSTAAGLYWPELEIFNYLSYKQILQTVSSKLLSLKYVVIKSSVMQCLFICNWWYCCYWQRELELTSRKNQITAIKSCLRMRLSRNVVGSNGCSPQLTFCPISITETECMPQILQHIYGTNHVEKNVIHPVHFFIPPINSMYSTRITKTK